MGLSALKEKKGVMLRIIMGEAGWSGNASLREAKTLKLRPEG